MPAGWSAVGWATIASWNSGLKVWPTGSTTAMPALSNALSTIRSVACDALDELGGLGGRAGRGKPEFEGVADLDHVGGEALDREPVGRLDVALGPLADVFHLGQGPQLGLAGLLQLRLGGRQFGSGRAAPASGMSCPGDRGRRIVVRGSCSFDLPASNGRRPAGPRTRPRARLLAR